ncbi:MAG TPA: adenylate/guanylate cyclase domain-containing protein [Chitinophagaceae bacterium]
MARLKLTNIISKKNEVVELLSLLARYLTTQICIEDEKGKLLLGECNEHATFEYPLTVDGETFGKLRSDKNAQPITELLNLLLYKEAEKKKLGTEVLNLYQELNLIFNFSEKLAQLIEPNAIAQTALSEARHLIASSGGIVVLFDERGTKLNLLASSGDVIFTDNDLSNNERLIFKIAGNGQSEIISDREELQEKNTWFQSVIYASLKVNHHVMGAIILFNDHAVQYTAGDLKLLTTLALQCSSAINSALLYEKNIQEAREREEAIRRIHEVTVKFVPREFIRSLGKEVITDVRLGDQAERVVTVLFSDIRNFTTLSEQMTPTENFVFVSSFNELMGPVIRRHHGFINQYLGDAIMAIFPGSADDAMHAAAEMQMALNEFNLERKSKNQTPIQIGIGMHTGPLIMGITGDALRLDATTISDTVNTTARIENLTKHFKCGIILTNETLQQLSHPENFKLRHLGMVRVKGKKNLLSIHECFSGNMQQQLQMKLTTLQPFSTGISYYLDKSFEKAVSAFQTVVDTDATDLTAKIFLRQATKYLNAGVPENWMAVEENLQ